MVSQLKRVIVGVKAVHGNLFRQVDGILYLFGIQYIGRRCPVRRNWRQIKLGSWSGRGPVAEPFLECRSGLIWCHWPDYYNRSQIGTKRRVVIALHVLQSERTDGFGRCLAQFGIVRWEQSCFKFLSAR